MASVLAGFKKLILIYYFYSIGCSQAEFTWKQCGNRDTFLVEHLDIKPYPVQVPGDMVFSLNMTLLRELNDSDIAIDIYWKTFVGSFRIPCLFQLGSCKYENACSLMDRMIRENWGGFMTPFVSQLKSILMNNGVDMWCPIKPQDIWLHNEVLRMPDIPAVLRYFTGEGDLLEDLLERKNARRRRRRRRRRKKKGKRRRLKRKSKKGDYFVKVSTIDENGNKKQTFCLDLNGAN